MERDCQPRRRAAGVDEHGSGRGVGGCWRLAGRILRAVTSPRSESADGGRFRRHFSNIGVLPKTAVVCHAAILAIRVQQMLTEVDNGVECTSIDGKLTSYSLTPPIIRLYVSTHSAVYIPSTSSQACLASFDRQPVHLAMHEVEIHLARCHEPSVVYTIQSYNNTMLPPSACSPAGIHGAWKCGLQMLNAGANAGCPLCPWKRDLPPVRPQTPQPRRLVSVAAKKQRRTTLCRSLRGE